MQANRLMIVLLPVLLGASQIALADGADLEEQLDQMASLDAQSPEVQGGELEGSDQATDSPQDLSAETSGVVSIEKADRDTLAAAIGHYARARSLLVSALREFDQGQKLANPDSILDSATWRSTLRERAQDLERILAPQARVTRGGVKYESNPAFIQKVDASQEQSKE
ncbi:MAG: hypothetical protein DCC75_11095 [Proteobacteria bacterium]|nr:MAG: hypothetical protein DCC75_11095 [Pseudomonadota bacterium]